MNFLKLKSKLVILLSVLCLLAVTLGVTLFTPVRVDAAQGTVGDGSIMTTYVMGTEFEVPDVTVTYAGEEYTATNGVLVTPDGNAYGKGTYTLDQVGKYKVLYSITADDQKTVLAEKEFSVVRNIYDVTSTLSSVEYAEDGIKQYKYLEKNNYTPWVKEPIGEEAGALPAGLDVTLAEGETLNIYKPYNLAEEGISSIAYMYINAWVDNYVAQGVVVRITDCYDSNNYINVVIDYKGYAQYRSGPAGAQDAWMFKPSEKQLGLYTETYIDGVLYSVRYDEYGPSFDNPGKTGPIARIRPVKVGFNAATGYSYGFKNGEYMTIIDNTNVDFFAENAFKGFTTGEVFVSVSAENYQEAKPVELSIMEIAGLSGADLAPTNYVDNVKPVIEVDYEETDENGVYIVKDQPFGIFPATAYDVNLVGDVSASVYYCAFNYMLNVPVKNGRFTPDKLGTYKIVYNVSDSFGNVGEAVCVLTCIETANGQSASIDVESLTSVVAGRDITVPTATVTSINGNEKVSVKLVSPDGSEKPLKQGQTIYLSVTGDYSLVYAYGDDYNDYTYEYDFTCVSDGVIRFIGDPVLPRHFIAGAKYSLEKYYAYDFSGENVAKREVEYYIKADDGEFEKTEDVSAIEIPSEATSVTVKYAYGDLTPVEKIVPVIDTGALGLSLDLSKYFAGDFTSQIYGSSYLYVSNVEYGENKLEFINKTVSQNFKLTFDVLSDYDDFESLNIVLIDYYDRTNKVVLSFRNSAGAMFFDINGEGNHAIRNNFGSDGKAGITVSYDPLNKQFAIAGVGTYNYDLDFASGYCLFDVEFNGIDGSAGVLIKTVLNQTFTSVLSDSVKPYISYLRPTRKVMVNTKFIIERAYAVDVVTPILDSSLSLRVTDPNKQIVYSTDGVYLNGSCPVDRTYEIEFTMVGTYTITYSVRDQNNKSENAPLMVVVVGDTEGPEISLKGISAGGSTSVSKGSSHSVKLDVSDNVTAKSDLTVLIAVLSETYGHYEFYSMVKYDQEKDAWNTTKIKITNKGAYTVYIHAYDALGNTSTVSYTLNVK